MPKEGQLSRVWQNAPRFSLQSCFGLQKHLRHKKRKVPDEPSVRFFYTILKGLSLHSSFYFGKLRAMVGNLRIMGICLTRAEAGDSLAVILEDVLKGIVMLARNTVHTLLYFRTDEVN